MDVAKLSKMLGMLKYQAGKDGEKGADASAALEVYRNLGEASERAAFLDAFESNGRGAAGFKFAQSFSMKVAVIRIRESSVTEDYTRRVRGGLLDRRPPHISIPF